MPNSGVVVPPVLPAAMDVSSPHAQMPAVPQVGQNGVQRMPCGCEYEEALFEQWAIGASLWANLTPNGSIFQMGNAFRESMVYIVKVLMGDPTHLTFALVSLSI